MIEKQDIVVIVWKKSASIICSHEDVLDDSFLEEVGVVFDSHVIILKTQRILNFSTDHDFVPHGYLRLFIHFNNQHQWALSNKLCCFAIIILDIKNINGRPLFRIGLSLSQILLVITKMFSILQTGSHPNVDIPSKGQEHMQHSFLDWFAFE